jgi:cell division protein FtsW (lipid II flippase)
MSAGWFIGWVGVLTVLAAMVLTPSRDGRGALLPQLATALIVLLLGGMALNGAMAGGTPSLEAWRLHIGAGEAPVTLGTAHRCDLTLLDPYGAPVHAVVAFNAAGPTIQSLSPDRKLEIDGLDIHHPELEVGSRLELGGRTWTVVDTGSLLPRVDLLGPDGQRIRLSSSPLRRLAGGLPLVGDRFEVGVATLVGSELSPIDHRGGEAPSATGPVAEIALRGRQPLLRFPTAADRHAHAVKVAVADEPLVRPADRPHAIRTGAELTLGYTTYQATIDADGGLDLEVIGTPPRRAFVPEAGLLTVGPGGDLPWATGHPIVLQVAQSDSPDTLRLISTDPHWQLEQRRGYAWLHPGSQPTRSAVPVTLDRGSGLIVSGDRHEEIFRYRVPTGSLAVLGGAEPGTPETSLVRAAGLCALLYLALTALLWRRGYLHRHNAAVFHGAALLLAIGLAVLTDLSPAGDPRQAHVVVRQAQYAAGGLTAALLITAVGAVVAARRPRHGRNRGLVSFLERPLLPGWGRLGAVSRVWLLWLAAAGMLLVQLPFGEQGLRLPWIGSLLPVEGVKTLLLTFVAFLGVRALEDKRLRLRGVEGLRSRWSYMLHAVPILVVAGLCFGVDDISPVLVLGLFLWVMYLVTLRRPARRFWPPRAWLENVYLEQAMLVGLALVGLAVLIRADHGTVAGRFDVWLDPWQHTASSPQFVEALWTMLHGGTFGLGFGQTLAHVPPAAHDDFVLAVLGNRTGLAGIALAGTTYALMVAGGLWAAGRVSLGSRPDLGHEGLVDRSRMLATAAVLMLAIQALTVFASVLGRAPVMGQPLPFLAAGGSHLLMFCLPTVGLLLVATRTVPRTTTPCPAQAASRPWFRRAVLLIAAGGVLATGLLGLRLVQLERAAAVHRRMHLAELAVDDLDGGLVIRPVRRGYRLVRGPGLDHRLVDGETFEVGQTTFVFRQVENAEVKVEVLAEPLRVYAARETAHGPRGGYRRIDIGGDPLGAGESTRDRIYVDHEALRQQLDPADLARFDRTRGVAHLLPADGEVFRLHHDRLRVVPEVHGLVRARGDEHADLVRGESATLRSGDRLVGPGFDLEFVLEDRISTVPIDDGQGGVVGHRIGREPSLVVFSRQTRTDAHGRRAHLAYTDRDGAVATVPIPADRPTLLYGAADRLLPLRGRVIPADLRHAELLEDFDRGLALGTIGMQRGFVDLGSTDEARQRLRAELGPAAEQQLVDLVRRYNEGESPAAVTVHGRMGDLDLGAATGWTLRLDEGSTRPAAGMRPVGEALVLAPPGDMDPTSLPAGHTVGWSLERDLAGAAAAGGTLCVRSDVPVDVALDGEIVAAMRGLEGCVELPPGPGERTLSLHTRITGRPDDYGDRVGVRVTCEGATLTTVRGGRQPFVDWTSSPARGRIWHTAAVDDEGYRWLVGEHRAAHDRTGFLQAVFDAPSAGPGQLIFDTAGVLEGAWLNGQPLPPEALPYLPGERGTVTVELKRGSNLLALRVRQPTSIPDGHRGGVRLRFDGGALAGLHPRTGQQRMAAQVPRGRLEPGVSTRGGGGPATLVVARGVPGLDEGTAWIVHDSPSLLWLPGEDAPAQPVLELADGVVVNADPADDDPFSAVNHSGRELQAFRQIDPMRRPYRPFGGFVVRDGWSHPLVNDRDALRLDDRQVTYRSGTPTALTGAVVLARPDGVHRLEVDAGDARIVPTLPEDPSDRLLVATSGGETLLLAATPGTAIYRGGELHAAVQVTAELPLSLRTGDSISCPASGLLLVMHGEPAGADDAAMLGLGSLPAAAATLSSGRARRGEAPDVQLTIEGDLQRIAADELAAQVALAEAIHADAGLELHPGEGGLRGAVVVMDAVDGRILAAASAGEEAEAADAWGLAWFRPGSTFKLVTALAAGESTDAEVRALVDGDLPEGLLRGAPGSLAGARLARATPAGGRWSGDEDRAIRLRSRLDNFRRDPLAPDTDLETALEHSYNVYFGYLALLLHRPLREGWVETAIATPQGDLVPLAAMARRLGFGQVLDLVPSEAEDRGRRVRAMVDDRAQPVASGDALVGWTGRFPEGRMEDPQIAACGVGQGEVAATPLQMARVIAAVANGGQLVHPTIIAAVDGQAVTPDPATDLGLCADNIARVRRGLRRVVAHGTAATTFGDNPYQDRIWGKTGSAERATPGGGLVTDSWFVGVLEPPLDQPAAHPVVVVCVMPGAGLGGTHAAEVVDRVSRYLARSRGPAARAIASNQR